MTKPALNKRELILKTAASARSGVVLEKLVEKCDASLTYVRAVLRDAGYQPNGARRAGQIVWSRKA